MSLYQDAPAGKLRQILLSLSLTLTYIAEKLSYLKLRFANAVILGMLPASKVPLCTFGEITGYYLPTGNRSATYCQTLQILVIKTRNRRGFNISVSQLSRVFSGRFARAISSSERLKSLLRLIPLKPRRILLNNIARKPYPQKHTFLLRLRD